MRQSLFEEYCEINPNFHKELEDFPNSFKLKFLQKLRNEHDRIEFLSKVSEFKFVNFFLKEGFSVDYEPKISNKTPDLRIRIDNAEIIGDVKRFNLSEEDQLKELFFYNLSTELKTIRLPYYVRIKQIEYFSFGTINALEVKEEFYTWLLGRKVKEGDVFNYKSLLTIEIINLKGIKDYILFFYSTLKNRIHPEKISSIVKDKISYYNNSIIKQGYPFFVCIDLVFDTFIDPEDFKIRFQGANALNINTGAESFHLGEFYHEEIFSKLLGILIHHSGKFFWIRNYRQKDYFNFTI